MLTTTACIFKNEDTATTCFSYCYTAYAVIRVVLLSLQITHLYVFMNGAAGLYQIKINLLENLKKKKIYV